MRLFTHPKLSTRDTDSPHHVADAHFRAPIIVERRVFGHIFELAPHDPLGAAAQLFSPPIPEEYPHKQHTARR